MAHNSDSNPHIAGSYAPLETLAMTALRRYGDFHPGTVDGEVMMMFIGFANDIIEELRQHPYWNGEHLDYYQSQTDVRPIPDNIIVAGLLYYYAMQQQSSKIQAYGPAYYRTMNQTLWNRLNGGEYTQIQLRVVDDGSNPAYLSGETSKITGKVS